MRGYLLISFLLAACLGDSIFHRQLLQSPDALCLDGSPGAFYFSRGANIDNSGLLLYFEGGGWCGGSDLASTLENCYQRSFTDLGSSKQYPETLDFSTHGVLSGDPNVNPLFYNWARVLIKYCDGSGYQGFRNASVSYKGKNLFFRGVLIVSTIFRGLDKEYGLLTASDDTIVFTGLEAGGVAATQWGYVLSNSSQINLITIPDSSILLDTVNVKTGTYALRDKFSNLMKLTNAEIQLIAPEGCLKQYPDEKWRCMFVEYLYPYLQANLFPVNSLYDTWSIENILGITCIDSSGSLRDCSDSDLHAIEDYKGNIANIMTKIAAFPGNGAWGIACAGNGYLNSNFMNSPRFTVPGGSNYTISFSLETWGTESEKSTHIDSVNWPDNKACAGNTINQGLSIM